MRKFSVLFAAATLVATLVATLDEAARADQSLRVQVDQHGDFVMIGNTLGWDCGSGAPAPVVGTVPGNALECGGLFSADSAPDVFWRSDAPNAGDATASGSYGPTDARSTAVLKLPAGALVTHAFLYWGGRQLFFGGDPDVVLDRPGTNGFTQPVTATTIYWTVTGDSVYQSVADVTSTVRANGPGAYRVSGVDVENLVTANQDVLFGGWALVVLYQLDSEPTRNLAVFDGVDDIGPLDPEQVSLDGFVVPKAGFDAKLGVITYEGDANFTGDSLQFGVAPLGNADRLSDALNPVDNFFNGTRSNLGVAVSNKGDLPQLTGTASSMAGIDLDIVDVSSRLTSGQTSVDIRATSSLDIYYLGAFVTSITTFKQDFTTSEKHVKDVNGGAVFAGDVLEYSIDVENTGNDVSVKTVVVDPLPTQVTLVKDSIKITAGPNAGNKTDALGDDQADYDAAKRQITVRVGTGANASTGGEIAIGGSTTITFRVTVNENAAGIISNQATIESSGKKGAPVEVVVTDGNGTAPGNPPTDIPVGDCDSDAQCMLPTPYCDLTQDPHHCVQCLDDKDCAGPSKCDPATNMCVCTGGAAECVDTDGDGLSDPDEGDIGTDPNDADSDNDGVPDGQEKSPGKDSDGDGLINALDPDSDDDGLFDGTEQGLGCMGKGTDASLGHCRPDADMGKTVTDPLDADTDDGSVRDGSEDTNLNGKLDSGETDPTAGHGADDKTDNLDMDGDGLTDDVEDTLGSDPKDADTDNDGLPDGEERNPSDDTDGDGLINVLDVDSDNDGLFDGTESGKDCSNPATSGKHCVPDADKGKTVTSPVNADTDGGSASDGSEDSNRNGAIDKDERNPTLGHPEDDTSVVDTDGDGVSDGGEDSQGSDPKDSDSDDDGVPDGKEANPTDDTDGDGLINVLDPDSDGDGVLDGTERGTDCKDPGTKPGSTNCVPDADKGKTTTSMVNPDTDFGGVSDGIEDTNHNGKIDMGERDPNDPTDDNPTSTPDGGVAGSGGAGSSGSGATGGSSGASGTSGSGDGNHDTVTSLAGGGCSVSDAGASHGAGAWMLGLFGLLLSGGAITRRARRKTRK